MVLHQRVKLLAIVALLSAVASGQDPTGAITGTVTDPSGGTVPRARATVKHKQTGQKHTGSTGNAGLFTVASLPAGDYELTIEADGFAPLHLEEIKVEIDRTIRLSLELVITGTERIAVTAVPETVDRDSNTLGPLGRRNRRPCAIR